MKYFYASLFLALSISNGFAQKQGYQWRFGSYAGLDFNSGAPVPVATGELSTSEGCSSIATKNGRLLFYTDGTFVYDSTNNYMPNGNDLGGNESTTQSALIVPIPGSNTLYYVFTADAQAGFYGTGDSGINYNIVDMTLNSGLGDVSVLDQPLLTPSTEKLCGAMACNDTDIWVVAHQWNSNAFYAYLITKNGISAPVISNSGIVHEDVGSFNNSEAIGYMEISPDGKKLALACYVDLNTVQIFDFDNSTGLVSNPITDTNYPDYSGLDGPYGVSFSPDNSKLYVSYYAAYPNSFQVYQYNMLAGDSTAIIASRTSVASDTGYVYGAIQIGPDGKMYVAKGANYYLNSSDSLDVIENPNGLGAACNYVDDGLYLGSNGVAQSIFGLPNMIENFLQPVTTVNLTYNGCSGNTILSFDSTTTGSISCYWYFGDTISGAADTSTLQNPFHNFSSAGAYSVKLIITTPCRIDTIIKTAFADTTVPVTITPQSPTVCDGQSVTLTASGGTVYNWSPETGLTITTGTTVVASPTATVTYTVTSTGGCTIPGTDVVTIIPSPNKPSFTQHNDTLISSSKHDNQWYRDNILLTNDTSQVLIINTLGEYWVEVNNEVNGCSTASDSSNITSLTGLNQLTMESGQLTVYPNPFSNQLSIISNQLSIYEIDITNVLGQMVFVSSGILRNKNTIDMSSFTDGMYFITVITATGREVVKAVKQ